MKIHLNKNPQSLNQSGIAHLLLMLVVVTVVVIGGVYLRVSHRDEANAASNRKSKPANGYIVLYSEQGKYVKAKITATNVDKDQKCSGLNDGFKTLSKKNPTKIKCSAINDLGAYNVSYVEPGGNISQAQAVDVDGGYCSLIHAVQTANNKVRADRNNCPAGDNLVKIPQNVSVQPTGLAITKGNKFMTGYVKIAAANTDGGFANVNRAQCVGSVTVSFQPQAGGADSIAHTASFSHPIKYTEQPGRSYCVAKFKDRYTAKAGTTYTVNATFPGSIFFNANSGSLDISSAK